jgi:hypothetical protein
MPHYFAFLRAINAGQGRSLRAIRKMPAKFAGENLLE